MDIQAIAGHTVGLLRGIESHDLEDLEQDITLCLIEQEEAIGAADNPEAYAHQVAHNRMLRWFNEREKTVIGVFSTQFVEGQEAATPTPLDVLIADEELGRVGLSPGLLDGGPRETKECEGA